ncbi:hypothetical protein BH11BAC2_BH11BAC2_09810 [soil metagenome]
MNIKDLHPEEKLVSATALFKGGEGVLNAIQLLKEAQLKEHITKVPAMLLCVSGNVLFENEKGAEENMKPGDYYRIEPMVKHWVIGIEDSQLVLIR